MVALLGDQVVPLSTLAHMARNTGIRPGGSQPCALARVAAYDPFIAEQGIVLDVQGREAAISARARELAAQVGGEPGGDAALLREVANLVEGPVPILGSFDESYLSLPDAVLLAVMQSISATCR